MAEQIQKVSSDDVLLWPDGDWCLRGALDEYIHKSDDFEVLMENSERWETFLGSLE